MENLTPYATLATTIPDGIQVPPEPTQGVDTYAWKEHRHTSYTENGLPIAGNFSVPRHVPLAILIEIGYGANMGFTPLSRSLEVVPRDSISARRFRDQNHIDFDSQCDQSFA